jgi:hypothetical protein
MRIEICFLDNVGSPYLGKKKKNIKSNIKKKSMWKDQIEKKIIGTKKKGFNLSHDLTIQSLMFARKRDQYIQTQSL